LKRNEVLSGKGIWELINGNYFKSVRFSNWRVYIYGIEGFWSYAKELLLKFHGVSRKMFG
jgi:hypothetical protein